MLDILVGIGVGLLLGIFVMSRVWNGKLDDLEHYRDRTLGLYATDQWHRITQEDLERLKLFRLDG